MAITDEQLQRYWEANPQELERAVASNPGMFGLSSQQDFNVGMPVAASQRPEPVGSGMMSGITNQQLENYWRQNPQALQSAIQQDPMAFLSQGLQNNFGQYSAYETALNTQTNAGYNPAQFVNDLRMQEDLAYVPGTGSGGEAFTNRQTEAKNEAFNLAEQLGMPLINEQGLALNTGFVYSKDGFIVKPGDGPVGEYNIVPERQGSSSAQFMTDVGIPLLLSTVAGPLAPTFGTIGAGAAAGGLASAGGGGNLEDIARGALTGGALAGLGEFLSPSPNVVGPDGLSNVVTNTASGAAANVAPNLAAQNTSLFDAVTGALRAQNPVGSLARGTLTSAVGQAIMNGEISLEDALKGGLITLGVDTVTDVFGDTRQTNDGNLELGVDTLNGRTIVDPDELARLTNTTDVYTLLGPEGILSKVTGLDVPYLPTTWLGNSLDFIDDILGTNLGGRPIVDPGGRFEDEARSKFEEETRIYQESLEDAERAYMNAEIGGREYNDILDLIESGYSNATTNIRNDFLRNTQRYDERFFDVFTPRGESPLVGIYENNPVASSGPIVTGTPGGSGGSGSPSGSGGAFGEGGPSAGGLPSAGVGTVFTDVRDDEDVEPAENIDEQEEAESLIEEDILGPGDVDTIGGVSSDSPLQSTTDDVDIDDVDKLPEGAGTDDVQGTVDDLVQGGGGVDDLVGSVDTVPSTVDAIPPGSGGGSLPVEQFVAALASTLPGGGGGGGRRRGGLFDGGKEQAKDFMANIEYIVPLLQQMNIPLEDFLAMWMNRE
jgi:hypothetical protein